MSRRVLVVSSYLALALLAVWANQAQGQPPDLKSKFADLDHDASGSLDAEEFPGTPEQFSRADRDGSGGIDVREGQLFKLLEDARKNPTKGNELRNRFAKGDLDGDGVISREEFPAPASLFERFDRDGDGQVGMTEALAITVEEEVAKAFEKHDGDLSGTLSREEFPPEQQGHFELADVDGDGAVTGEEAYALIYEIYSVLVESEPVSGEGAPRATPQPSASASGGTLDRLAARFADHDRNADGVLNAAEFPGSVALRAELDRTRDQGVSMAEVRLAQGRAKRLIARAQGLRQQAAARGLKGDPNSALALEARGLLMAGRLGDLEALLDDAELRLLESR